MSKKEEKATALQETMKKLEAKYGKGTVLTLETKPQSDLEVYSTGSIAFDHIALGIGGFAKGKLYELMGWEGTGKSTICGHVTAECQRLGGTVLYVDGEHAVDKKYFKQLGVNTETMLLSQPSHGEEGYNIALDMINSGGVDLVIIDSDSSLIPKKVLDGDIGDHAIGHKAKLNSSAYPKLKTALSENNVCVIVISQFREKIGVMFGDPRTTQGGHALKFYTDCRIEVKKTPIKEGNDVVGHKTTIKVLKNKMAAPFKIADFEIKFGVGIDKISEVINLLTKHKLGRKRLEEYTFDGTKYKLEDFKQMFITDKDFYKQVVSRILEKINPLDIIDVIAPDDGKV
jgi:recombination protein RecA